MLKLAFALDLCLPEPVRGSGCGEVKRLVVAFQVSELHSLYQSCHHREKENLSECGCTACPGFYVI